MGLIVTGIFQRRQGDAWVDVATDADFTRFPIDFWLAHEAPDRGLPADFEIVNYFFHPTADASFLPPNHRTRARSPMGVYLGDDMCSWITAEELIAGTREFNVQGRPDLCNDGFLEHVRTLVARHGQVRLVFGVMY